jgi:hypothetical protein
MEEPEMAKPPRALTTFGNREMKMQPSLERALRHKEILGA